MKVYTYSEARQRLATLLEQSRREGQVQIRRRDGQLFVVRPAVSTKSPLDVPGVKANLEPGDLMSMLQESRESGDRFWRGRAGRGGSRARKSSEAFGRLLRRQRRKA